MTVSQRESGRQPLLEPGLEGRPVHRAVENERRNDLVIAQAGDESRCFPVPMRHTVDQPHAFLAASPQPRHLRVGARLVDEDQLFWIKRGLRLPPFFAQRGDIGSQLLAGVQRFFYSSNLAA